MTAYTDEANILGATQIYGVDFADTEWKDESGNGLHLTRVGSVALGSGPGDGLTDALDLDGIDDYAGRGDEVALDLGDVHTVCFWSRPIYGNEMDSFAHIVGKGNSGWYVRDRSNGFEWVLAGTTLLVDGINSTGQWRFCVARQDATTRVLRAYNTSFTLLGSDSGSAGAVSDVAFDFSVGAQDNDPYRRFYEGAVAGVAVFDGVALTDTQIESLFDSTFEAAAAEDPANLQATVDGDQVTLTHDASF